MLKRLLSSIVLATIVTFSVLYNTTSFTVFIVLMMSIALYEAMSILSNKYVEKIFAIIYIFLGCMSLIILRDISLIYIIYPFLVVWSCDIFAFFIGCSFGQHKLAPKISPKKSWEGAIGGLIFGTLVGTLVLSYWGNFPIWFSTLLSIECSIIAILGDLLESAIKRRVGVKDSGKIIPGHGGVLDRIDSLIPASILVFVWFAAMKLMS